jgi:hypothetical protein
LADAEIVGELSMIATAGVDQLAKASTERITTQASIKRTMAEVKTPNLLQRGDEFRAVECHSGLQVAAVRNVESANGGARCFLCYGRG